MSDTPRTDTVVAGSEGYGGFWVPAPFARQLERENTKLRETITRLEHDLRGAKAIDAGYRPLLEELRAENAALLKWKEERQAAERATMDFRP